MSEDEKKRDLRDLLADLTSAQAFVVHAAVEVERATVEKTEADKRLRLIVERVQRCLTAGEVVP